MKNCVLAGLAAAQMVVAAQPASAAGLEQMSSAQTGTFAGARLRISLGGKQEARKVRAGLTVAPTLHSRAISGATQMRFGEGLELGLTGKRPLTLSLGGRPVSHLVSSGRKPEDDQRLGVSTGGYVAIGVGVVLVAVGVGYLVLENRCTECDQ